MKLRDGDHYSPIRRLYRFSAIPNQIMRIKGLSPYAKLIFGRLTQYAGDRSYCFPRQQTIAKEVGCSLRQVQVALKELERRGLLETKRPDGIARWKHAANRYYFVWRASICANGEYDESDFDDEEEEDQDE